MAELITTDKERAAASYLDWDDASLGRFTKYVGLTIGAMRDDAEGLHKVTVASCAMVLVGAASDANVGHLSLKLDGHSRGGIETGDWTVTVKRRAKKDR